jgi:glycosyltransferase involved in cell wall biosynthesis
MEKDKRIRYVKNTHRQGAGGARNQGIEAAGGDYIAFLDSDDEWMNPHLERMVYYLTKYPDKIDLMTANAVRKNKLTGKPYSDIIRNLEKYDYYKLEDAYVFNADTLFDITLRYGIITIQTVVCKRDILDTIKFDESILVQDDIMLSLELARRKVKIAHLQEYHLIYWAHGENLTTSGDIKNPDKIIKIYLEVVKFYFKIFEKFRLTNKQEKTLRKSLAKMYFWYLGYSYLQLKDYIKANEYFLKGIKLRPFNLKFWKTYIARIIFRIPL